MRKKRKRRKKQSRFAFTAGFTALLFVAFATLSVTVFFNIRTFSVEGEVIYDLDTVVKSSGISLGDNLFRMNKFDIQRRLEKKLPYIKTAVIKREFPEGLCFVLTPAVKAAVIDMGDEYAVIDDSSKCLQFYGKQEDIAGLPIIIEAAVTDAVEGERVEYEDEKTADTLFLLFSIFDEQGYENKVSSIDIGKSYDIVFMYEDRIECHIGTTDYIENKLRVVREVISRSPDNEKALINAEDYTTVYYKKK